MNSDRIICLDSNCAYQETHSADKPVYKNWLGPIISTYYIDDETSKQCLRNYPSALCLDTRKPIRESVESLDSFIEKKLNTSVDFSIVRDLFPINSPQAFLNVFEEIPD